MCLAPQCQCLRCCDEPGTSVHYIEKTYARHSLTAVRKQSELTKGQGYWRTFEESEKDLGAEMPEDSMEVAGESLNGV